MTTTEQDARALTYLARRIRQETYGAREWDEAGIWAEIKTLIGQNLPLTIERVTRHAADPDAKTPGAIRRPFVPEAPTRERPRPPKRHEECPTHPGHHATGCSGCAADRLAGDATEAPNVRRNATSKANEARAALAAARIGETA